MRKSVFFSLWIAILSLTLHHKMRLYEEINSYNSMCCAAHVELRKPIQPSLQVARQQLEIRVCQAVLCRWKIFSCSYSPQ